MFENPRRGRLARNFTTSVPKILVLKSSSEQIFSRKLPLGAPALSLFYVTELRYVPKMMIEFEIGLTRLHRLYGLFFDAFFPRLF